MNRLPISRRRLLLAAAAVVNWACRGPQAPDLQAAAPAEASRAATSPAAATGAGTATPTATPPPSSTPTPAVPTPTPAPQPAQVWIDPNLPASLNQTADQLVNALGTAATASGFELRRVDSADNADVRVTVTTTAPDSADVVLMRQALVPIVSPRLPVRAVKTEQLTGLLGGSITDWSKVGAPASLPVQLVNVAGMQPGTAVKAGVPDYAAFVSQLDKNPGALGLAPAEVVDFQVGTLAIDDVQPLLQRQLPTSWPLWLSLIASGSGSFWVAQRSLLTEQAASLTSDAPTANPLTVTFSGDVILGRTVHTIISRLGDYAAPFRKVSDELKTADLTILDLECTLSDTITPPTDPYTFSFMTRTAGADGLTLSGVDAVSQANNHSMNFGAGGMRDTLAALDARKILHFGIGENLDEARKPVVLQAKGMKLALLGCDGITGDTYGATSDSAGTSPLVVENLIADIKAVRPQADLVIPFVHWGIEYTLVPTDGQRAIAHQAIDAGADMVVGSHCHWVQGMETYKGKAIVYSLANFVFDQDWSLETKEGLIMHLVFHGKRLAGLSFVPVMIENFYQPRLAQGSEVTEIMGRVWKSTDIIAGVIPDDTGG